MAGRFSVVYGIRGSADAAERIAREICVEQTVEFPPELITDQWIKHTIIGRVESASDDPAGQDRRLVTISYADECAGDEITQFLNVLFGNTSLKPGIRIERVFPSPGLLRLSRGPRFGINGIRTLTGARGRPLLASALKPMGLDPEHLARIASALALGGIDIIKDDHGLANQGFSPFRERVKLCARAVANANKKTGGKTIYAPNITSDGNEVIARARFAKKAGAAAFVISPGLTGFAALHHIAMDESLGLPVIFHPAFLGSFAANAESGIGHRVIFGELPRMFGADAVIFPNFGGRFSFSMEECGTIVTGATGPIGKLRPSFPMPGGGMTLDAVPRLRAFYGDDVVFLMGGGLFRHSDDLTENVRHFRRIIEHG